MPEANARLIVPIPTIRWLLSLCVMALLAGCAGKPVSLSNDAYIWQRQWTPALVEAVAGDEPSLRAWRVLAAEMDGQGQWRVFRPDWRTLAASKKPVIAVVRIEGQLRQWDETSLLADVQAVLVQWRAQGLSFAGIEIDHDCATSQLPQYAHFLQALRPALSHHERLSVTALPTWLDSSDLNAVLAQADEAVLQVHAVQSPRAGLFNPDRARAWLTDFAKHTNKPWRVAMPAYGTRVSWDDQGRVSAIESERPTLIGGDGASELIVDPRIMQTFVSTLETDAPRGLAGIVWFRLPTSDDERAWSEASWHAVLARVPLQAKLELMAADTNDPKRYDVRLRNAGSADLPLPALLRIEGACTAADGIRGYRLQNSGAGLYLERSSTGVLRSGRQLTVGWLRCASRPVVHAPS